jgi:hypothetical protein
MENKMETQRNLNDIIDKLETIYYTLNKPLGKKSKEDLRWYVHGLKVKVIDLKNKMKEEILE